MSTEDSHDNAVGSSTTNTSTLSSNERTKGHAVLENASTLFTDEQHHKSKMAKLLSPSVAAVAADEKDYGAVQHQMEEHQAQQQQQQLQEQLTEPQPPPPISPRKKSTASPSSKIKSFKASPVAHLTGRAPFPVNKALPQPQLPSLNPDLEEDDDDEDEEEEDENDHRRHRRHRRNHHRPTKTSPQQQHRQQQQHSPLSTTNPNNNNNNSAIFSSSFMSVEDLEICQRLDFEYERALEEREIAYNARFHSVRQSAVGSVAFMLLFLFLATIFYMHQTHWSMSECLLFSVYTITTVGYGSHTIPATAAFQLYTICFIFIGVATLTIMVAQIYQCIALEASRAQHSRDQSEMARRGLDMILTHPNTILQQQQQQRQRRRQQQQQQQRQQQQQQQHYQNPNEPSQEPSNDADQNNNTTTTVTTTSVDDMMEIPSTSWDRWNQYYQHLKFFFQTSEWGRGISVLFPFAGLILVGAIVVGPIEGWTPLEALYFAVVSLTTVGFGDYFPTKTASIWFCIIWLPFSVGFMSLFLGNIANFYLRLSDQNIQRIERQLRRRLRLAKERAEQERMQILRRAHRGQDGGGRGGGGGGDGRSGGDGLELVHMADGEDHDDEQIAVAVLAAAARRNGGAPAGFDVLPMQDGDDEITESEQAARRHQAALFGSPNSDSGGGLRRRERILYNSIYAPVSATKQQQQQQEQMEDRQQQNGNGNDSARPRGQTMATMRDVLRRVRINLARHDGAPSSQVPTGSSADPESEFMSRRSTTLMTTASFSTSTATSLTQINGSFSLKPSFALRVLVQERMAEIIAIDIAGFQSSIEIKDNTLSVTIETLKQAADKWLIPRRARKAFRAVAFEALYFVGEHGLITRGADALYDLTPFEFHGLFNPLLAAMGDAEMMEAWLANTEVLAEVDLKRDLSSSSSSSRYAYANVPATTRGVTRVLQARVQGRSRGENKASPLPQVT